jgi:hypothetical protein
MTIFEIPRFRHGDPQLLGKVAQDIGLDIAQPGRKSRPRSEEAQLKRKPDPAGTIDPLDQSNIIKGQAPNLDKRPFQFVILPTTPETASRLQTVRSTGGSFMLCSIKCPNMHVRACWAIYRTLNRTGAKLMP